MKMILAGLLSLIFLNSHSQNFSVRAEIDRAGRQMIDRHAAALPDTCLSKAQILAAKMYVDDLEDRYGKALQDISLLELRVDQRGERISALESTNQGLQTKVQDYEKNQGVAGWVCATLGAAGAALAMLLIGH